MDENSVYVEYDVDEEYLTYNSIGNLQTTIPVDNTGYFVDPENGNQTNLVSIAQAPTNYADGFIYSHWVVLNSDESESSKTYVPGDGWTITEEGIAPYVTTEIISDEFGNSATMKVIRLKAKFNVDENNKATMVTFDGNGGVTNDSAAQESVTEPMQVNKDFSMKDGDSFVREGYTLIGWAFQRSDGSKISSGDYKEAIETKTDAELVSDGIYKLGQKVAADNLKVSELNNWDPLENTVYAVWQRKLPVTITKIGEADIKKNTPVRLQGVEFTLYSTSACDPDSKIGESVFSKSDGTFTFYFDTTGTYYLKETTTPDGYEENNEVYTITVSQVGENDGGDGYRVTGNGGDGTKLVMEEGLDTYQILNTKMRTGFVLKKTDDQTPAKPLTGAEFKLEFFNRNSTYEAVETKTVYSENGVMF